MFLKLKYTMSDLFIISVEDALKKLLKHQQSMIKSLQEGQRKVKLDAEQTVGMEIAHHIKVLAEKSDEVQRYKNVAELLQNELRIVSVAAYFIIIVPVLSFFAYLLWIF